jgi:hypothetical protein
MPPAASVDRSLPLSGNRDTTQVTQLEGQVRRDLEKYVVLAQRTRPGAGHHHAGELVGPGA